MGTFKKELNLRMEMKRGAREELEIKTKRLHAQQSFIARQEFFKEALMEHLSKLKQLIAEPD